VTREPLAGLLARFDADGDIERTPLLAEMAAAGGVARAGELARSADAEDRWVAARVMELLPDEAHVEPLAALVRDPHRDVAAAARRALRGQVRSAEWTALVERLARDEDPALADAAAGWLTEGIRS
jgi:hypothetical protein